MADSGIQILVTPLGGASPSGASAEAIRSQLQKALSGEHGVKVNLVPADLTDFRKTIEAQLGNIQVNVTPNINGGGSGKGGGKSGGVLLADFEGMVVSTRKASQATAELTKQRLAHNEAMHQEELRSKSAINASKEEAQARKTATTVMQEQQKQAKLAQVAQEQVAKADEKRAQSVYKLVDALNGYRTQAYNATSKMWAANSTPINADQVAIATQISNKYKELEILLNDYQLKGQEITKSEKIDIAERISELKKLVASYQQVNQAQSTLKDSLNVYRSKAQAAAGSVLTTSYGPQVVNSSQIISAYQDLNALLLQYERNGTVLSKSEINSINERIAAIRQLTAETTKYYSQKSGESARSAQEQQKEAATLASMKMELASFNQYLTTLNPKAITQYAGEINNIRDLLGSGVAADAEKAAVAMKQFKAEMVAAGYQGGNAIGTLVSKTKQYFQYFITSALVMGLSSGVSTLISNVKELDEAMTDLRIVTGDTREETYDLLKTYNEMAQTLGTTTAEVSSGAVDWLRQGYSGDEAKELLTQSMTLSIVGDMDSASSTDALTAALKGYKLSVEEASDVVDKFFAVDMKAATSSENLALALAKTAANAELAGLSLDDVIGQLAVVNEKMKEDGSSTGDANNCLVA